MSKILVVIDMQNDFVSGALGTAEAVSIVGSVKNRIKNAIENGETVIFTRDTHGGDYMETQEGKKLPVPHCIKRTLGWEIVPQLAEFTGGRTVLDKPTFGSRELGELLCSMNKEEPIESIMLIGICTDICVISNAMLIKAFLPETEIIVDSACCAGVSPISHENALAAMEICQIKVI